MTTEKPLIVITAGGTGGHVYPADSLAEELLSRGYELALITDSRGKDNYKGSLSKIKNYSVLSGPLVGKSRWTRIKNLFKTSLGILQSIFILLIKRPACVVGFGGYASFPCSFAAILLNIDLIIHEQNSVMSRTNRFLARFAKLIAQSFKNTKFTPGKTKSILTGMPVRKTIAELADKSYPKAGKTFQLMVLGGSQGSKILTDVVPQAVKMLDKKTVEKLKIYQQCRKDDLPAAEKAYKGVNADITLKSFFENMPELYSKTNLIISRAGSSTVFEISAVGLPSILVPLAIAADDHQTYNAKSLEEAKASIVIKEKDFNADTLYKALSKLIDNYPLLQKMSANAKKTSITDAQKRVADAIEKQIKQKE